MVIPIVAGSLGMVFGGKLLIIGRIEITQTTALLRSTKILGRVSEIWEDLLSLRIQWKTISLNWCEKLIVKLKINFE